MPIADFATTQARQFYGACDDSHNPFQHRTFCSAEAQRLHALITSYQPPVLAAAPPPPPRPLPMPAAAAAGPLPGGGCLLYTSPSPRD